MSVTTASNVGPPLSDVDPFSTRFLTDPYEAHEQLREAGPVVRLERYGILAMARYEHVHAALEDWESYCSASGVGLSDFRKEPPWRPPSLILEADPPLHDRTRAVLSRVLSSTTVRKLRPTFERKAAELVARLVERGSFDGIEDLAKAFPLEVFPDAVGLPQEGRENLLPYGNMVFNAFGPRNELFESAMADGKRVAASIMEQCRRDALAPDGLGALVYTSVDTGEISADEAALLVRSLLSAGLDTTVNGIGNALLCFVENPEQWQRLHENPVFARAAFEEVVRYESPVQTFFRTTTRPVEVEGTAIDAGEKVLLFLAAANRDRRRWEVPDRFDITRKVIKNVGFGTGIHVCVGGMLARLEAEIILTALARRVRTLSLAGQPRRRLNNTLRGLESLPIAVTAA